MGSGNNIQLSRYRWRSPIPACCMLQLLFGFLYANGVFIALLDEPHFTVAIGVASFCASIGISIGGVVMNKCLPASMYEMAPVYTALIGSLGLSSHLLIAFALTVQNTFLLFVGAILLGMGGGCVYVVSVDVLQAWAPDRTGMVTGIGLLCGSAGSMVGICIFSVLSQVMAGPIPAMALVGALSGVVACIASCFVRRPPHSWRPETESSLPVEDGVSEPQEDAKLLPSADAHFEVPALLVSDILTDSALYLLLVAFISTEGPGFGFVLGFQRMCTDLFGIPMGTANELFFCVTLMGFLGRICSGIAIDTLDKLSDDESGLRGPQRTTLFLLIAQTIALLAIPFTIHFQQAYLFVLATCVVYIAFSGGTVSAACLVRGIFTPKNSSLAFSVAAASVGFGDMFVSWIMAKCGQYTAQQSILHGSTLGAHGNDYNLFLFSSLVLSLFGLIAAVRIRRSEKVIDNHGLIFSRSCSSPPG